MYIHQTCIYIMYDMSKCILMTFVLIYRRTFSRSLSRYKCAILSFSVINSFPFPKKIPKLHFMNRIRFRYLLQSTNIILYMNKIKFSIMIESLYCICNKPSFLMSSIIQFKSTCTNLNTNILPTGIYVSIFHSSNLVMFIDRN